MDDVKRFLPQKTPIGTVMKESREGYWVQAADYDAQRLRADTAEADLLRTSDALIAAEQRIAELVGAVRSINHAKHQELFFSGDDEPQYPQRKEWIDWILSLCDDLSAPLSTASPATINQQGEEA